MAVSNKHILQQGPVLAALGQVAFAGIMQDLLKTQPEQKTLPGPEITRTVNPLPLDLVRDYVKNVGGDPGAYKKTLPPHLFPQWGFPLASKTLIGIPYSLLKVMNGGCRIQVKKQLPNDEPLFVRANLQSIDDNGRRAVLHQHIVTGTASAPESLISDLFAIVPLGGGSEGGKKKSADRPRVPENVKEIAYWKIGQKAGLDFAKLTGDFNPIHWIPAYARASGFKNTILHGFATMARTMEGLSSGLCLPGERIEELDVKFTKPLVLPAKVGLYVSGENVYVGDAPGGPAYLVGTFKIK
ncbi:MaoC family dehydratase [Deltaproteobacteria bacterium TL4]